MGLPGDVAVRNAGRGGVVLSREVSFYTRPLLMVFGFIAVTLPWLVLLIFALEGQFGLLNGFVGDMDLTHYVVPMAPPGMTNLVLLVAALLPPLLLVVRQTSPLWKRRNATLGLCVCAALLAVYVIRSASVRSVKAVDQGVWGAAGPAWSPYAGTGGENSGLLFLYLPTLAFWAAFAKLVLTLTKKESTPTTETVLRLWYLTAGSALLLNQYPRMDTPHMVWSGGMLLVVGADLLHGWYQFLLRRLPTTRRVGYRSVVRLSVVLVPLVAAIPQASDRIHGLYVFLMSQASEVSFRPGVLPRYVQLTPPGEHASVWAPAEQARPIQEVVSFLRQHTAPGEPIFAYPAIPGFYFLADRPNATRFNHLFRGLASPRDQEEMIGQLEAVRYIVWDAGGAHSWVSPRDNARLTEYILANFRLKRAAGIYTILSRGTSGPPLSYSLRMPVGNGLPSVQIEK
jgi:hypothetical protein